MADQYPDLHSNLLISLQKSGEHSAFENLYDAYSAVLFGVIFRIVADPKESENLLQDCFVKIWRNIKQYSPEKGRAATWLINIARHTAIDFIRSPYYKNKINILAAQDSIGPENQFIVSPASIEPSELQQIVEKLTPECREVIERMYFEGYTQQEISDTFGIPLGTVKTRSRTALKELRTYFNHV